MGIEYLSDEELKEIRKAFTIYIVKVIKHSAIDFIRKQKKYEGRIVYLNDFEEEKVSLSMFDNDILFFEEKTNYSQLEKIMTKEKNRKAVKKLTDREKEVMYLIIIEELDTEEIAKRLKISTKTVLNTKNNALKKLRKDLGGNKDEK